MSLILQDIKNHIGTIIFNNYEKRNALSKAFINEIIAALEDLKEKKVRVVILRGHKRAKVWSSGHDIKELMPPGQDPLSYNDPLELLFRSIEHFPAPVIAMIEGGVFGGGCELAFTCDILIASPKATFAITPAKLGIPYNASGILHFINMMSMSLVKEMFFTAAPISATRAHQVGIVNHLIKERYLERFTYELAEKITRNSPLSISAIKEQLRMLGKAHPLSPAAFERLQDLRRIVYESQDYKEGIQSFFEKRPPKY